MFFLTVSNCRFAYLPVFPCSSSCLILMQEVLNKIRVSQCCWTHVHGCGLDYGLDKNAISNLLWGAKHWQTWVTRVIRVMGLFSLATCTRTTWRRNCCCRKLGWLLGKSELMLLLVVLFGKLFNLSTFLFFLFLLSALTDDSEGKRTFTYTNMALCFRPSCYSHL